MYTEDYECTELDNRGGIILQERGDFNITYDDDKWATYICPICKGDKFIVGAIDWSTIMKCPTCKWESVIHEG